MDGSPCPPVQLVGSIAELVTALVRIPSQSGIDPLEPMATAIAAWLADQGLEPRFVNPSDRGLGVVCPVGPETDGPIWILDAPLDTAPIGDLSSWSVDPTAAEVKDGWLYGRGSADCKAGMAIFAHLGRELNHAMYERPDDGARGRIVLLFDGDEHSGQFGGARAYFESQQSEAIGGVMIGYPGQDKIVTGGRGVARAMLTVHGPSGHSGSTHPPKTSAVQVAASIVQALGSEPLHGVAEAAPDFPLPPRLTVTAIHGGTGFSSLPDRCEISVDIRVTPSFPVTAALDRLHDVVGECTPGELVRVDIELLESWPAYQLPAGSVVGRALVQAAAEVLGYSVPRKVAGPSNTGNYLAGLGIEATAGFGVACRNLHGFDEAIDLSTLASTYAVYRRAVDVVRT